MRFNKTALIIILTALTSSMVFYIVIGGKVRSARENMLAMKASLQNTEELDQEMHSLRKSLNKSRAQAADINKLKAENERTLELLRSAIQENDSLNKEITQLKETLAKAEQAEKSTARIYNLNRKRDAQTVDASRDYHTEKQVSNRSSSQPSRSADHKQLEDTINEPGIEVSEVEEEIYDSYNNEAAEIKTAAVRNGFVSQLKNRRIAFKNSWTTKAIYIGAKKCKACHMRQYKSWQKTTMADSFENLKAGVKAEAKTKAGLDADKDYTHDKGCLKCHTTGYGKAGGFTSIEATPDLAGVQCEGCHGPGSGYAEVMKKNKTGWKDTGYTSEELKAIGLIIPSEEESGCMTCHGGDSPFTEKVDARYKFDFKDRLKKTHGHYPLKYKR